MRVWENPRSYKGQGRISAVSDHTGREVSFTYDEAGDLVSFTDVLGNVWTYIYDAEHHLTQVLDPDLVTHVRTEYNPSTSSGQAGRAVRQYNGEGELMVELEYLDFGVTKARGGGDRRPREHHHHGL